MWHSFTEIQCSTIMYCTVLSGFYLLGGAGGGEASPPKVLPKKKFMLFQVKIFFDDDFKESVKVPNVQKCDFSKILNTIFSKF